MTPKATSVRLNVGGTERGPNQATDADFDELKRYFSNEQIVELVGVIELFGWLNRWNDTMNTILEDSPASFYALHNLKIGPIAGD